MWMVGCAKPSHDRIKSLKQVVTALLTNARQEHDTATVKRDIHLYGHLRVPTILTPVAERSAVELSLPVLAT